MHTLTIFQQTYRPLDLYIWFQFCLHMPSGTWVSEGQPSSGFSCPPHGPCPLVAGSPALNFLDHAPATWNLGIPNGSKPIYRMCTQISTPENKQVGECGLNLLMGPHWHSRESKNSTFKPDLPSCYEGTFIKARK